MKRYYPPAPPTRAAIDAHMNMLDMLACPSEPSELCPMTETREPWGGTVVRCVKPAGHEGEHGWAPLRDEPELGYLD